MEERMILTCSDVARKIGITLQAVYAARKTGKLKGFIKDGRWMFHLKDVETYIAFKYNRERTFRDGKLLFDKARGKYSPTQLANHFGVDVQAIYHKLRANKIKHTRVGASYVIDIKDIADWMIKNGRVAHFSEWK